MKWAIVILSTILIAGVAFIIWIGSSQPIMVQEFFAKGLPEGHTFQAGEYDIQIIRTERKKQLNIQEVRLIVSEKPSGKVLKTDCNRKSGPEDVSLYTNQTGKLKVSIKNPIGGKTVKNVKVNFKLQPKDPRTEKEYKLKSETLDQIDAGNSRIVSIPIGPYELGSFTVFCLSIEVRENLNMLFKKSKVLDEKSYLLVIKPKLK